MCFVCFPVTKLAFISIRCIVWCCKTFLSAPFRRTTILPYEEDSRDSSLKIRIKRQVIATTFCQQSRCGKHGLEQERYLQNRASVPTRNCVKIFPLCQNRRRKRRIPPTSHAFPSDKPQPSAGQGTPVQHFCHAFRAQKTGLLGAFGTDILHSTKASPLIIKAMPPGKRTPFSPASHTSAGNKPFSTTQNNEKARQQQPKRLSLTAWLSFHILTK